MVRVNWPSSKANLGKGLEDFLVVMNELYYLRTGIAAITKLHTEWLPIRYKKGEQPPPEPGRRQSPFKSAKVLSRPPTDFIGNYDGIPVAFEVKETGQDKIRLGEVDDNEEEFLNRWSAIKGAQAFVLVNFTQGQRTFVVPWSAWGQALAARKKDKAVKASYSPQELLDELAAAEVVRTRRCPFDYLAALDKALAAKIS